MTGEMKGPAPEERPEVEGKRNAQGSRIDPDAVARDLAEAADIVVSGRRAFAGAAAP